MDYRVGFGYDIHRLVGDRKLFIGGVEIPYIKGLFGHSDGDALLHAVCDALLGAMGEGDIGEHFPDNEEKYRNIASEKLLKSVNELMKEKRYRISNLDAVIIAQEPVLSPFKKEIKRNLSGILQIMEEQVNIKAKTNEGLGEIGRKEAISCYATVLIIREERI